MLPETIGRYDVRGVAGAGGFATVYEGFDPRLDARVAIKVLADNWSRDPEIRRRFRQEAVLLRRLQAERGVPGLVQVFDIDESETGQPFFVMGWADRGMLADRVGDQAWSPDAVVPVVHALTQSLGHLHAAGVVHRDIKPQNLLVHAEPGAAEPQLGRLVAGERIVVGDLGLAKDLTSSSSSMSLIGGTERYMAPEQLEFGASIDHRADIYAASMLIDELVRGSGRDQTIAAALEAALRKGSAFDPAERHQDMTEWQHDLLAALTRQEAPTVAHAPATGVAPTTLDAEPDLAPRAPDGAPSERRANPATALRIAAAVVIAALVAIAAVLLLGGDDASAISGPDRIVSGESGVYRLADATAGSVSWTDPSGAIVIDDELVVVGRLPGTVTFSAAADGERHERTVVVEPSPDGPTIVGPETVGQGDQGVYSAVVPAGHTFFWIHPTRGEVIAASLTVEQTGEQFVVGIVSIDSTGVERGQQMLVEAP